MTTENEQDQRSCTDRDGPLGPSRTAKTPAAKKAKTLVSDEPFAYEGKPTSLADDKWLNMLILPEDIIIPGDRIRPLSQKHFDALLPKMTETGINTTPVIVCEDTKEYTHVSGKTKLKKVWKLVAGLHRCKVMEHINKLRADQDLAPLKMRAQHIGRPLLNGEAKYLEWEENETRLAPNKAATDRWRAMQAIAANDLSPDATMGDVAATVAAKEGDIDKRTIQRAVDNQAEAGGYDPAEHKGKTQQEKKKAKLKAAKTAEEILAAFDGCELLEGSNDAAGWLQRHNTDPEQFVADVQEDIATLTSGPDALPYARLMLRLFDDPADEDYKSFEVMQRPADVDDRAKVDITIPTAPEAKQATKKAKAAAKVGAKSTGTVGKAVKKTAAKAARAAATPRQTRAKPQASGAAAEAVDAYCQAFDDLLNKANFDPLDPKAVLATAELLGQVSDALSGYLIQANRSLVVLHGINAARDKSSGSFSPNATDTTMGILIGHAMQAIRDLAGSDVARACRTLVTAAVKKECDGS